MSRARDPGRGVAAVEPARRGSEPRGDAVTPLRRALARFFFACEPVARVHAFRVCLGVWTALYVLGRLPWADEVYALPVLRTGLAERLLGLGPPPLALVVVLAGATLAAIVALLAGIRPRVSQALVLALFAVLTALEVRQQRAYVELALVQWALLQCAPVATRGGPTLAPRWGTRLVMLQLSAVYLFAGLGKLLGPAWRSGEAVALIVRAPQYGEFGLSAVFAADGPWPRLLAWSTIAAELFIAVGLWGRRTRRAAMLALALLHLGLAVSLRISPLFHLLMLAHLVLFAAGERERCAAHNG